jgi:hypothetical protein
VNRYARWSISAAVGLAALAIAVPGAVQAGAGAAAGNTFKDDFARGIVPATWKTTNTSHLYRVTGDGAVRFSTPGGGPGGFQWVGLQLKRRISGDFDVSVRYSNASIKRVNGSPGNQVQLNAVFGKQIFCVVRSDEAGPGSNYHVWTGSFDGARKTSARSGMLRIVRVGSTVSGYAGGVRLYQRTFNAGPVTQLWFSLQNNGTTDAISVTFDDFSITADKLG